MNHHHIRYRWAAAVAALLLIFCSWYPPLQELANQQTDAGLQRAVVTFASARALNGLISVVQGTEFSAQLGLGVTLTLGQVLDPINDLVEQFSSLMLFASVAFGVQKMLLAIGGHWLVSATVTVVALCWALLLFMGRRYRWLTRLVLVLLMIRLAIPIATIGSDAVFRHLMAADYESGQQSLQTTSERLEAMTPKTPESNKEDGMFDKLKKGVEDFKQGVAKLPDYEKIKQAATELPEKIIRLIVVFLMQTVALPLLMVWGLYAVVFGAGTMMSRAAPAARGDRPA